jgi:integrase
VPLAEARTKAEAARIEAKAGRDPLETRAAAKANARRTAARAVSFRNAAENYIASHAHLWRNAKHASQWSATLASYAYPVFGDLPVSCVDQVLVIQALEPIWTAKPETASRVRGRIETILDWAKARGLREGENPAAWKGNLQHALPKRDKRSRGHHAALPFADAPAFWATLAERDGAGAKALAFAILTAARTGEVIGADWSEFDLSNAIWTVPAERMKAGREHRVPLSAPALVLLRELHLRESGPVFVGPNGSLSNMALLQCLRRMGRDDLTAHGFRSTFRDWAAELTAFPREVAEAAIAHTIPNAVEAAYRRGDLFEKRRTLMGAWAQYLTSRSAQAGDRIVVLAAERPAGVQ